MVLIENNDVETIIGVLFKKRRVYSGNAKWIHGDPECAADPAPGGWQ